MNVSELAAFHARAQAKCEEVVRANNIAVEQLTEKQIAQALIQAIQCGDFIKCVQAENQSQAVIYIPFAQEQKLKTQIKCLKELLRYVTHLRLPVGDVVFDHLDFNRQQDIYEILK